MDEFKDWVNNGEDFYKWVTEWASKRLWKRVSIYWTCYTPSGESHTLQYVNRKGKIEIRESVNSLSWFMSVDKYERKQSNTAWAKVVDVEMYILLEFVLIYFSSFRFV